MGEFEATRKFRDADREGPRDDLLPKRMGRDWAPSLKAERAGWVNASRVQDRLPHRYGHARAQHCSGGREEERVEKGVDEKPSRNESPGKIGAHATCGSAESENRQHAPGDHAADVPSGGPKGRTDADFPGSLLNRPRERAIESDRGQYERENSEDRYNLSLPSPAHADGALDSAADDTLAQLTEIGSLLNGSYLHARAMRPMSTGAVGAANADWIAAFVAAC